MATWIDNIGGDVSDSYDWVGQGQGLFSDALNGWLQYETIQAQRDATVAQQAQTRNTPTTTSAQPRDYADTGGAAMPSGITGTHLVVGGVLLAAAVLVLK